jgi:signal transduction histidine kinase/ActR/RegA family two-component response regulator
MFWWPAYRINALVKFLTAVFSIATISALFKIFPEALLLKTSREFEIELNERRKVEKELTIQKNRAETSEKVKDQFLVSMSHEIRTPMNVIIGFTRLLEETKLSNQQQEWVHDIKYAGENLLTIINDILDFAKIKAGRMQYEQNNIKINELVRTTIFMLMPKADEKNIALKFFVDPKIPSEVIGDSVRVTQVLINLLSNAIKFTHFGEVKVDVSLLNESDENVSLQFSVCDTGIGIPEDKLQLIFDSFTQVSDTTSRIYGGTGLGLAIAKKLVEEQGGTLTVKSKYNEGSCFLFTLPFRKNGLKEETDFKNEIGAPESIANLNILLVEDNPLNQKLAKFILEKWKLKVDIADNGRVALNKINQKKYDLVLMDVEMPEMDGYEATRKIRKGSQKYIPIIAMTAHAQKGEEKKCFEAGMNDYISKPFDPKVLLSKIIYHTTEKTHLGDGIG